MDTTDTLIAAVNAEMDANYALFKAKAITWAEFGARQIVLHNRIDAAKARDAWLADWRASN
jgi:hypothetical protein